jgi:hypothetical protein
MMILGNLLKRYFRRDSKRVKELQTATASRLGLVSAWLFVVRAQHYEREKNPRPTR